MLEINQLSYGYPGKQKLFKSVNLTLHEGHVYGLLGRNGAGKTTLLNLISGLLFPQQGSVEADGVPTCKREADTLGHLFYMPDEFQLAGKDLREYFDQWGRFYPDYDETVFQRCLETFQADSHANLEGLSLGERKKVLISFALAVRPRLLLMDEPTNGLDIPSKTTFRQLLMRETREDAIIVISTHQVHDVENLLDQLVILRDDHTLWEASTAEIMRRYTFGTSPSKEGAIYAESSPSGYNLIRANESGEESAIDLELLYNAVTKGIL